MSGGVRMAVVPALIAATAGGAWAACESGPPPIQDNSFLVEEAYNQEAHVVQHIGTWTHIRPGGEDVVSFTQEWPFLSQHHQLSYTLLYLPSNGAANRPGGWGDFALNYRYQLLGVEGGRLALAPRVSLLFPTGDAPRGLGSGSVGGQFNLPLSLELSERFVSHTNLGATYVGRAGETGATIAYNAGQSLIWLAAPGFNPLVELAWFRVEPAEGGAGETEEGLLVSPGFRWAHNLSNGLQIVPGIAVPIGVGAQKGDSGVLLYLSFEHGY